VAVYTRGSHGAREPRLGRKNMGLPRGAIAGYGAYKLGGGCLSVVLIFIAVGAVEGVRVLAGV
jgi:hypothetical protein